MPKIVDMLKNIFVNEILEYRRRRDAKFLFVPKVNVFLLARVLLLEFFKKYDSSDRLLISLVLNDLVNRKVLHAQSVKETKYNLGEVAYFDIRMRTFDNQEYCRGTSTNRAEAYAKCVGEVFERFTLKHYTDFQIKKVKLLESNKTDDGVTCLDFESYPKVTPAQLEQFPFFQFKINEEIAHIKATNIKTQDQLWVSLQAFTLNSQLLTDKKKLVFSSTNGAGAGYSQAQAKESGLLEILHRHYFLNSWFQKISPDKIVLPHIGSLEGGLFKKYKAFVDSGFEVILLDLSRQAGVPTVVCILKKWGGWHMGAATKTTLHQACDRAIDEAMATYIWSLRQNLEATQSYAKKDFEIFGGGFLDSKATAGVKVKAFANSYFLAKFDNFFVLGQEHKVTNADLEEVVKFDYSSLFSGPVFEYIFQTDLLSDYKYHVAKYFVPEAIDFALDEIHTRPLVKGVPAPKFTQINPFP